MDCSAFSVNLHNSVWQTLIDSSICWIIESKFVIIPINLLTASLCFSAMQDSKFFMSSLTFVSITASEFTVRLNDSCNEASNLFSLAVTLEFTSLKCWLRVSANLCTRSFVDCNSLTTALWSFSWLFNSLALIELIELEISICSSAFNAAIPCSCSNFADAIIWAVISMDLLNSVVQPSMVPWVSSSKHDILICKPSTKPVKLTSFEVMLLCVWSRNSVTDVRISFLKVWKQLSIEESYWELICSSREHISTDSLSVSALAFSEIWVQASTVFSMSALSISRYLSSFSSIADCLAFKSSAADMICRCRISFRPARSFALSSFADAIDCIVCSIELQRSRLHPSTAARLSSIKQVKLSWALTRESIILFSLELCRSQLDDENLSRSHRKAVSVPDNRCWKSMAEQRISVVSFSRSCRSSSQLDWVMDCIETSSPWSNWKLDAKSSFNSLHRFEIISFM